MDRRCATPARRWSGIRDAACPRQQRASGPAPVPTTKSSGTTWKPASARRRIAIRSSPPAISSDRQGARECPRDVCGKRHGDAAVRHERGLRLGNGHPVQPDDGQPRESDAELQGSRRRPGRSRQSGAAFANPASSHGTAGAQHPVPVEFAILLNSRSPATYCRPAPCLPCLSVAPCGRGAHRHHGESALYGDGTTGRGAGSPAEPATTACRRAAP